MTQREDSAAIAAATRRVVGVAVLRRLRRIVDEERATEAANAQLSRILLIGLAVAAALVYFWFRR